MGIPYLLEMESQMALAIDKSSNKSFKGQLRSKSKMLTYEMGVL